MAVDPNRSFEQLAVDARERLTNLPRFFLEVLQHRSREATVEEAATQRLGTVRNSSGFAAAFRLDGGSGRMECKARCLRGGAWAQNGAA